MKKPLQQLMSMLKNCFIWLCCIMPIMVFGQAGRQEGQPVSPESGQKYNVLFIAIDDLRPELGCYGQPVHSPHIDQLAANGLLFKQAYCQEALCSPSRTSMLTGLRPDATQVYGLKEHFRTTVPDVITLPQHFKQQGYRTVSLGKIFHSNLDDTLSWNFSAHGNYQPWVSEENLRLLKESPEKRGKAYEAVDAPDTVYFDGKVAQKALRQLQALQDQPFFLAVGFIKPHLPFAAPQKYWDLYERDEIQLPAIDEVPQNAPDIAHTEWEEMRHYHGIPKEGPVGDSLARTLVHGYRAAVSFVDAQVGLLLDELERLELKDNTIVVVWGDHGWKLGEYGKWSKHTNYELDTRAPLIIYTPDMKEKGKTTDALVELIDIYPTLSELAGLPVPTHVQGKSFVPLLENPELEWKPAVFSQYPRGEIMGYAMKTLDYRLVRWQEVNQPDKVHALELYDHIKDPHETVNVAGMPAYKHVLNELNQMFDHGWSAFNP